MKYTISISTSFLQIYIVIQLASISLNEHVLILLLQMQRVTVQVYGHAVCWQELSSLAGADGKKEIIFLDRWRIEVFFRGNHFQSPQP